MHPQGASGTNHEVIVNQAVATAIVAYVDPQKQILIANQYKNAAIDFMACNNVEGITDILRDLEGWDPTPATLTTSGLSIIFHDIKFWQDADLTKRAAALREKFRKIMKKDSPISKCNSLDPFQSLSHLQFRQAIDNMTAHMRGSQNTVSQDVHKKLAYHIVMRGFTLPQTLEGLNVVQCGSFASSILDVSVLSQAIAAGTAMAKVDRDRIMAARSSEMKATFNSVRMVNAWAITLDWNHVHLQASGRRLQKTFMDLGQRQEDAASKNR